MKKRIFSAILASAMLVGMLVLPASAGVNGVGSFGGVAEVGQWFTTANPCTKDGTGDPAGRGLYAPEPIVTNGRSREGTWSLTTGFTALGTNNSGVFDQYDGSFNVCGWLDQQIAGLGGACGASKGFHGKGRAVGVSPTGAKLDIKLYNIGWKEALGAVLPVTGNYQAYAADGSKKAKHGTITALVQVSPGDSVEGAAQGVQDCLNGDGPGVQDFTVNGAFTLSQPDLPVGKTVQPPMGEKSCLGNGPDDKDGPKPAPTPCKSPGPQK